VKKRANEKKSDLNNVIEIVTELLNELYSLNSFSSDISLDFSFSGYMLQDNFRDFFFVFSHKYSKKKRSKCSFNSKKKAKKALLKSIKKETF